MNVYKDLCHMTGNYDDYNWDWSLQHVSQQCLKLKLHAMVVKGPRVFHIGECGE
jgi:alpha-1,6-mannosyl-glycoprotein beta-1,2-N-acetylglucosaminyltransferase